MLHRARLASVTVPARTLRRVTRTSTVSIWWERSMLRPNDTLGPYTLIRPLGRGGFGEVWLAERRSSLLTTQVALKLPSFSEDMVEVIAREARTWLRASGHPNIVPVL